jgi:hypothetical protein
MMKIPGSAKRTANGREAVTDDNPCAVEAGGWTPPASVQSFANAACDFMVSRPIATLWSKTPYRFELLLFAMAAAVRFYDLHYPDSVVFDEYHFGAFVNKYNWGKYFFDIHPPLGKLTLLWVGQLTGYDATTCSYDSIHDVYADNCKYMILRNVAGAFAPPGLRCGAVVGVTDFATVFVVFSFLWLPAAPLLIFHCKKDGNVQQCGLPCWQPLRVRLHGSD